MMWKEKWLKVASNTNLHPQKVESAPLEQNKGCVMQQWEKLLGLQHLNPTFLALKLHH